MSGYIEGVISEGNKLRPLSLKEYRFWLLNPLPFNWIIITKPKCIAKPNNTANKIWGVRG